MVAIPEGMQLAIEASLRGWPAPNPHVGCALVREGVVLAVGHHEQAGGPHAEIEALRIAGDARGATAYVTLEPCNHHGRTGPCSQALIAAGVVKVVIAVSDPNPIASGGILALRRAGIEVEIGVGERDARRANYRWLWAMGQQRPFVLAKAAVTPDGFVARLDGTSKWITSESQRASARRLRAKLGSVLVGRGTVEADDPALTVRDPLVPVVPVRLVWDPEGRLGSDWRIFDDAAPTLRIGRGGDVPSGSWPEVLAALWERGIAGVMIEGGANTLRRALDAGVVDEIILFRGTELFGAGKRWAEGFEPESPNWVKQPGLDQEHWISHSLSRFLEYSS